MLLSAHTPRPSMTTAVDFPSGAFLSGTVSLHLYPVIAGVTRNGTVKSIVDKTAFKIYVKSGSLRSTIVLCPVMTDIASNI